HGVGAGLAGVALEGAVAAVVAAEVGQGEEDLPGVGDRAPLAGVAERRGRVEDRTELSRPRVDERAAVGLVQSISAPGALEDRLEGWPGHRAALQLTTLWGTILIISPRGSSGIVPYWGYLAVRSPRAVSHSGPVESSSACPWTIT